MIQIDKTKLKRRSKQYTIVVKLKDETGVKYWRDIEIEIDV